MTDIVDAEIHEVCRDALLTSVFVCSCGGEVPRLTTQNCRHLAVRAAPQTPYTRFTMGQWCSGTFRKLRVAVVSPRCLKLGWFSGTSWRCLSFVPGAVYLGYVCMYTYVVRAYLFCPGRPVEGVPWNRDNPHSRESARAGLTGAGRNYSQLRTFRPARRRTRHGWGRYIMIRYDTYTLLPLGTASANHKRLWSETFGSPGDRLQTLREWKVVSVTMPCNPW